jgi:hypothetical protein
MTYESEKVVESAVAPGVAFTVAKMSFARRMELMRRVRELAGKVEFLNAGSSPEEKMDAALLEAEVDRLHLAWGLRGITGLELDGRDATPESLVERGPEELFREALDAVRTETGLSEAETKN